MRRGKREYLDDRESVVCRLCGKRFQAITVSHLRFIHERDGEHPVLDYKDEFHLPYAYPEAVLEKFRATSRKRSEEAWADLTPEVVVEKLREYAKREPKAGLPERLGRAARHHFGTVRKAARRAGLSYTDLTGRVDWTKAKVVKVIREVARKRQNGAFQTPTKVLEAAERLFGSFTAAVEAAGLDYRQFVSHSEWSKESVLSAIRRLAKRRHADGPRGRAPEPLRKAAIFYFGSWQAAAREACVEYQALTGQSRWSKERVVSEIEQLAEKRRKEPARMPPVLTDACKRYFGSVEQALKAAGWTKRDFRRLRWERHAAQRKAR